MPPSNILTMYDAAVPQRPLIAKQYDVAGGYIGSRGATPHVWTLDEWNSQDTTYRLPIYVPSFFRGTARLPLADAVEAVNGLRAIRAPEGITIALDFETVIDGDYVTKFDQAMRHAGYFIALYGSTSSLFQNPVPSGGYWPADYLPGRQPHMHTHPHVIATQYGQLIDSTQNLDLDWILDSVPLWNVKEREMTLDDEVPFSPAVIQQLTDLDPNTFGPGKEATVGTILGWTCARVAELLILVQRMEKK